MFIARPQSLFSRSYFVCDEDGNAVAELAVGMLKEGAVLHHEGKSYRIERAEFLKGPWCLKDGDAVVFEAHQPTMVPDRFTTVVKNASLELSIKGRSMRNFIVVGPDWADLGYIRRVPVLPGFSARLEIHLSDLIPVLAQLFMLFQVVVLWKRVDPSHSRR
jgi:hypothetical protein